MSSPTGRPAESPIRLYDGPAPGSEDWTVPEQQYFSDIFGTEVVTNVIEPTLTPVTARNPNGTGIVVAPGGGYHSLSIEREGFEVARWLADRGITAFVLKYRLAQCVGDAVAELVEKMASDPTGLQADMAAVGLLAGADGIAAMHIVRSRAAEFDLDPDRIGFMGFSAGGNVTLRVILDADDATRPNFSAPIYAATRDLESLTPPDGSGPIFLAAATDDELGLTADSIAIYDAWFRAGLGAELHLYARGGHGFGMGRQGLPSDGWIDRFGDWLAATGLIEGR